MVNKKISILFGIIVIALAVVGVVFYFQQSEGFKPSIVDQKEESKLPSVTLKEHVDSSGFSFTYPDDLSLTKNEPSASAYADIELSSKETAGSIKLKIEDNKISQEKWLEEKVDSLAKPEKVKLGELDALESKIDNRLLLAASDLGVLFTIDVLFEDNEQFWLHVYKKILTSFSFHQAAENIPASSGPVSDVIFEGEEVIE